MTWVAPCLKGENLGSKMFYRLRATNWGGKSQNEVIGEQGMLRTRHRRGIKGIYEMGCSLPMRGASARSFNGGAAG